jgi:hypothetical protein
MGIAGSESGCGLTKRLNTQELAGHIKTHKGKVVPVLNHLTNSGKFTLPPTLKTLHLVTQCIYEIGIIVIVNSDVVPYTRLTGWPL